ncbi:MAG: hypothetical protein QGG89_14875, partial [Vicinamibacterales bacterium]|nr:hypothetical protein [Vicinamibacterales bacterium]
MRKTTRRFGAVGAALALASGLAWLAGGGMAPAMAAGDDISGVVTGARGGEAGVWVIAETDDLETTFRKIVVTDDEGRF